MKYKIFVFSLLFLITNRIHAQGIEFRQGSFQEILNNAQQQNKLIFVDVYTDWCAPCKGLSEKVFPQPEVGEVFNANFINYKINAEKGEGIAFAKKYKVSAYPTLLWIDGKGNLVYRSVGGAKPADLIVKAQTAQADFTGPNSYQKLKDQYTTRKQDTAFLSLFMKKSAAQGIPFITAFDDYLLQQKNIPENSKEMMILLLRNRDQIVLNGKAFTILDEQRTYFETIATPAQLEMLQKISPRIEAASLNHATETRNEGLLKEYIAVYLGKNEMEKRSSEQEIWLDYYLNSGQQDRFAPLALRWLDSTFKNTDIPLLHKKDQAHFREYTQKMKIDTNNTTNKLMLLFMNANRNIFTEQKGSRILRYAYALSKRNTDKAVLNKITTCAALSLKMDPTNPTFLSTYSSILYQAGKKEEAIQYRQQAIALLDKGDKKMEGALRGLELMKAGKELE